MGPVGAVSTSSHMDRHQATGGQTDQPAHQPSLKCTPRMPTRHSPTDHSLSLSAHYLLNRRTTPYPPLFHVWTVLGG